MPRVALDYRPALFQRGGIARYVRELARALTAFGGIDLHLFGHGLRRAVIGETGPAGASLHRSRLPGRALPALAALGIDGPSLAGGAEVFHWTDYVYPPVRAGRAVVQTVHDLAFLADDRYHGAAQSRRLAARFRAALSRADLVLCPSEATRRHLRSAFPAAPEVRVVPFGIDHVARFRPSAARGRELAARWLRTDADYGITVGTIEPRKNHEALLAALDRLAERGRQLPWLVLGAAGWCTQSVGARLASGGRAGLPRWVWRPSVEDRDLFDLIAGARLMVYPSSLEGFGFPPLEALSLGVCVLAGDCDALREQLGDSATFVRGDDASALAAAIDRAWDEPRVTGAVSTPTWSECARLHVEAYTELASRRRASATAGARGP